MRDHVTYIGFVYIDATIEAKINEKHNLTASDVREAIQFPAEARAFWEDHPVHGRRLITKGTNYAGRVILAVLQPVDERDGTWALRSARAAER